MKNNYESNLFGNEAVIYLYLIIAEKGLLISLEIVLMK